MRSHNKKFLSKVSKILAEDNKVFIPKSSSFMFCQNFIKILHVLVVTLFLITKDLILASKFWI